MPHNMPRRFFLCRTLTPTLFLCLLFPFVCISTGTQAFAFNVGAANTAPVAHDQSITIVEDTPVDITLTGTDADGDRLTFLFVAQPPFFFPFGMIVASNEVIRYTPRLNFTTSDFFHFKAIDPSGAESALATVRIFITPVNDKPVITAPRSFQEQLATQQTPFAFSSSRGNQISVFDPDFNGAPIPILFRLTPTHGTVTLKSVVGLTFVKGDGIDDAESIFRGDFNSINAALQGFTFNPERGYVGPARLQIFVDDEGNSGTGGNLFDIKEVSITVRSGGVIGFFGGPSFQQSENGSIIGGAPLAITRSDSGLGATAVTYTTTGGTATGGAACGPGVDYVNTSGTISWAEGDFGSPKFISVPICNESLNEPDETIELTLSNLTGSATLPASTKATLIIVNDDAPLVQFAASNYTASEGDGRALVSVARGGDISAPASVFYSTKPGASSVDCQAASTGVASERCDFVTALGTINFAAGQSEATFSVPLVDDVHVESPEVVTIDLSTATGASLVSPSQAVLTIVDNDSSPPAPNPLDSTNSAAFFVRQQYLDLLSREPDAVGFAGWQATLDGCPNSGFGIDHPTCDRVRVSAGFFQSLEFQTRGYFAYRFYQAALGRRPDYAEFIPDMVKVGGSQSPAQEAASKQEFTDQFVNRQEFKLKYDQPQFQAPADYVNELERTAGVELSNKAFLIAELSAGRTSRAQVLRAVVESSEVEQKFFNVAFVTMQYFGYLRRNPDELGFAGWIKTLNENGDFRHMIFGFIYSDEYRQRFGPK